MSLTFAAFLILGALALGGAIYTVVAKNPIISALSLVFTFAMLAGVYLTLRAQFIAIMQILVYSGAIMTLVVFAIMLLNLGDEEKLKEKFLTRHSVAVLLSVFLIAEFVAAFVLSSDSFGKISDKASSISTVQSVGEYMYSNYGTEIAVAGVLLLAAIVGAVSLAKKKLR